MAHLILLALKVAANVFDLSSGQAYVSIRDQIVRARLMIRDLGAADPKAGRILVVGAGVAGVAAAVAAARAGFIVDVVDCGNAPFGLQKKATHRYVGPFMYEWPSHFHDDQSYPPDAALGWGVPGAAGTPQWRATGPITGTRLARHLGHWLRCEMRQIAAGGGQGKLRVWTGAKPDMVRNAVRAFTRLVAFRAQRGKGASAADLMRGGGTLRLGQVSAWPGGKAPRTLSLTPDYIILGAGLGEERTTLEELPAPSFAIGPAFWEPDALRSPSTANERIGVFGGGDGALQDVLRALTRHEHPLRMMDALRKDPRVAELIAAQHEPLLALEQQTRLLMTWGGAVHVRQLDRTCAAIARQLAAHRRVRAAVAQQIRPGDGYVQHFVLDDYFGKAYLLNRFVLHLIIECMQPTHGQAHRWNAKMRYECHLQVVAKSKPPLAGLPAYRIGLEPAAGRQPIAKLGAAIPLAGTQMFFDKVAIRYGVRPNTVPGSQMVSVSKRMKATRVAMSPIPLPYVIPG